MNTAKGLSGMWGFALSGICNLINGKLQRDFQEEQNEINREANRQMRELELKEARQKEDRLREFEIDKNAEKSSWPLKQPASKIRAEFKSRIENGVVPVMVIIANVDHKTVMQKSLGDLWMNMSRFMNKYFPSHGNTPIFYYNGGYKEDYAADDADIIATHDLIPDIPTIFLAPHTRKQDNVLSVLVASWGFASEIEGFHRDWFDLDIRTPYVDAIRKEINHYLDVDRKHIKPEDEKSEIKKNIEVFEKEREYLAQGFSVAQIDQQTRVYSGLTPLENTYESVIESIAPLFKMLLSAVIDLYYVYECRLQPRVPQILSSGDICLTDSATKKLLQYYTMHISAAIQNGIVKLPAQNLNDFSRSLKAAELTNAHDTIKLLADNASKEEARLCEDKKAFERAKGYLLSGEYGKGLDELMFAAHSMPIAMFNIGTCFFEGKGCKRSVKEAVEWYQRAVEAGYRDGRYALAIAKLRLNGMGDKQALNLLIEVASEEDERAQWKLALLYFKQHDLTNCARWAAAAARNGNKEAELLCQQIEQTTKQGKNQ